MLLDGVEWCWMVLDAVVLHIFVVLHPQKVHALLASGARPERNLAQVCAFASVLPWHKVLLQLQGAESWVGELLRPRLDPTWTH